MATIKEKEKKQEQRQEAHRKICADYLELKCQYPTEAPYNLFETLAKEYKRKGLKLFPGTAIGVKNVIVKNGLYYPQR